MLPGFVAVRHYTAARMPTWRLPIALFALVLPLALLLTLPTPVSARATAVTTMRKCQPHKALDFLKRPHFVRGRSLDGHRNDRAVRFRVSHYGHVDGVAFAEENAESALTYAASTRFFGLPVQVHRRIQPVLSCVETRIRYACRKGKDHYVPHALGGFRNINTYRGGEVSNHLFGIAIDIDPDRNPCCGCVEPWPEHPACQAKADSVFDQSALPRCWVEAFERHGFYWLGRDPQLRDTMHFEYLGNPERLYR